MRSVAEVIEKHHAEILRRWTQGVKRAPFTRGLSAHELTNAIPAYLSSLCHEPVDGPPRLTAEQQELVERHMAGRLRQGADLHEILLEFSLLSRCVSQFLDEEGVTDRRSLPDVARLFSELYLTSVEATKIFNEHLLEDEQLEKRTLRRLQHILGGGEPPAHLPALRQRLAEAIDMVREAVDGDSAALLLVDPGTGALFTAAASGAGRAELDDWIATLEPTTFAGAVAAREGAAVYPDAEFAGIEPPPPLREAGMESLVGVRLSARRMLRGLLFVGKREPRGFGASDIRLLEDLGETLAGYLDAAEIEASLRHRIDELGAPLLAAKVSLQKIIDQRGGETEALAARVAAELDELEEIVAAMRTEQRARVKGSAPLDRDDGFPTRPR
jgi:hypothetical protein